MALGLRMNIGFLRPVGERIPAAKSPLARLSWPDDYHASWFESGTAALAMAIRVCVIAKPRPRPAVLVPAYTCPDVVSAVIWAGAHPVLVDCAPEAPWLNLPDVTSAIDNSVVAVVAPHFLGIPQPLDALLEVCRRESIILVEDSAQLSPASVAFGPTADLVILSFGRGKPIPVGGGVLLSRRNFQELLEIEARGIGFTRMSASRWQIRRLLQNAAIGRFGFRAVRSLPLLEVGKTRFRPLEHVRLLQGEAVAIAEGTIANWRHRPTRAQLFMSKLADSKSITNLPLRLGWDQKAPLLRYPLLVESQQARDNLISTLEGHGIGATSLYGQPLHAILRKNAVNFSADSAVTNADDFSRRLVTIPSHSDVRSNDLEIIRFCLQMQHSSTDR